jgi:hypothetical protein
LDRDEVVSPWLIPAHELSTQRYLTLRYNGPEGDGVLKLALRLETPERYSLEGSDRLGRSWFKLAADGDRALYLDQRERTYCRFSQAIEIAAVPLGPLPFDVLPALLLDRLPVVPAEPLRRREGEVRFRDEGGRRWSAELSGGAPVRWTLLRDGRPAVWWFRRDGTSYLSASEEKLQLRWRQGRVEPLLRPAIPLDVPEGYSAGECR